MNFSALSASEIQGKHFLISKPYTSKSFTGHEAIDEFGLIHMKGRVYNPTLGIFIQADPLVEDVKSTQAFNRYSYVQNNPLNATDPTGMNSDREKSPEDVKVPEIVVTGTRPLEKELTNAQKTGKGMAIAAILRGNTVYGAFISFDPSTGVISNVTYATAQATKNFISYVQRRGGSFVTLKLNGATGTTSAENAEGQNYSVGGENTFLDGAKSFFEDMGRVEQHYRALSGKLGEEAKQHALAADLSLTTASAAYYFDSTIEINGKTYRIREQAQSALTKAFYDNTEYFAGRAFAQGSVGMATTTVMNKALGIKLFSRQTAGLYASVWAGNAGSLLTVSSFGRGLSLYDQGVRDPISLLSGSVIGK